MTALRRILLRDLRLALRQRSDALMVVLFFVLTGALFPFGIGPEPNILARIAPGIIWVTALLAVLLSLERLFLADYEDGALELMALSPTPLTLVVLAKALAHWLTTGLPLIAAKGTDPEPLRAALRHGLTHLYEPDRERLGGLQGLTILREDAYYAIPVPAPPPG